MGTIWEVLTIPIKPVSVLRLAQAKAPCLYMLLRAQGRNRAVRRIVASLNDASLLLEGRCNAAWDVGCKLVGSDLVRWCQQLVPVLR